MKKKLGFVLLIIFVTCSLAACGQKLDSSKVGGYADKTTEEMLLAYNENDYGAYEANANEKLKGAVSEEAMQEAYKGIRDKIGTCIPDSKKFKDALKTSQDKEKFIVVRYNAKFTDEKGDVLVTMSFEDNASHKLAGIYFNSPNLQEK